MGDCLLMICRSCKAAEWCSHSEVVKYVEEHTSHNFTCLRESVLEDRDEFRAWFLRFMRWAKEAEG